MEFHIDSHSHCDNMNQNFNFFAVVNSVLLCFLFYIFWVAATFLLAPFNFHFYYFYFISIFNHPVYHSQPIQCILLLCFLWPTCCVISTMNVFFFTFSWLYFLYERVYMRAYVCVWWKWESGGFRNKRSLT